MRKLLDKNLDRHFILLSLLIFLGLTLKIYIYHAAWSPVGVILLFLIRMGAFFDGIIIRPYDAWDNLETNKRSTPPDNVTDQLIEDEDTSSDISNSFAREMEKANIRRDIPIFNLLAMIITMM